jgi:hydrogenase expression/formation protein HypE
MNDAYPLGKLPPDVLAAILARHPLTDPRVLVGPRPGEDAAVIDLGGQLLVTKIDPITFASDEIGWYVVNVNANDIATMGAKPAWFMATLLLPQGQTTRGLVERIFDQIDQACAGLGVTLVGGHTEITYGIDRPIVVGSMFGLTDREHLITTAGAQAGDTLIVTKGFPIEATAIIAREKRAMLAATLPADFLDRCAGFLHDPGISVVRDAQIATQAGRVHAMHDPTEGGLATGLWEMADASGRRLSVDYHSALLEDSRNVCAAIGIDPLGAIASGSLLMAVEADDAEAISAALEAAGIPAFNIGRVEDGPAQVVGSNDGKSLARPARDEIARLFE